MLEFCSDTWEESIKESGIEVVGAKNGTKQLLSDRDVEYVLVVHGQQGGVDSVCACINCDVVLSSEVQLHICDGCLNWDLVASSSVEEGGIQIESDGLSCDLRVLGELEIESNAIGKAEHSI